MISHVTFGYLIS